MFVVVHYKEHKILWNAYNIKINLQLFWTLRNDYWLISTPLWNQMSYKFVKHRKEGGYHKWNNG